jgi:hypothetical protein
MRLIRGFLAVALVAGGLTVLVFILNGVRDFNGRQTGIVIAAAVAATLLRVMWLTPGGWRRPRRSPGPPVDGAPLSDRDRLILAQMEGQMNGTPCLCGCPREPHLHDRRGTDCAFCGCPRYRRDTWFQRALSRRRERRIRAMGYGAWDIRAGRRDSDRRAP